MASSTIVTDLTIHTAHFRLRSGKYMLVYYTNEYDEDGNPINITIYDSSETLIENPPYEIVYEVTKTIPPPEGDWLNNLWFKNGVNSLSPRQSPGQTNNIFLGFETAENFDLTDLATYSGDYNFIAGYQLATSLTTGSYNTIFGSNNHSLLSTGSHNFANGENNIQNSSDVQFSFTNGKNNLTNATSLEASFSNGLNNAPNVAVDATHSFFSGDRNLFSATLSGSHTFMSGFQNAYNATGADFTTLIGYRNLYTSVNDIQYSIGIGRENAYSGTAAHTGSIYLGYRNSYQGGGLYVNYQGWENGYHNTGNYNIGFGSQSLYGQAGLSSGGQNIAMGRESLYNLTTGSNNIAFGYQPGFSLNSGYQNILLGNQSGNSITSGENNVLLGTSSGIYQTGNKNVGIGYRSLYGQNGSSSGSFNVGIGSNSGFSTTGTQNVFLGLNTGYYSTGNYNLIFGTQSFFGQSGSTTGSYNVAIGYRSGYKHTTGDDNIFIGTNSGYNNNSGYQNTYLGKSSGYNNISGNNNVFIGYQAGFLNTGSNSIFLGYQTGYNETGSNKLYIANTSTITPLIYGEFDNEWIRINGYLEVRDKTGTATNVASWDGDKIIESGVSISSLQQTLSYTDSTNTIEISGTLSSVQLTGLAEEMELSDTLGVAPYTYRALDVAGTQLGDEIIFAEGTDISITKVGQTLTFAYTGSGGGDPDQTLTWTNTSTNVRDLTISGTGNTVELDGLAVEMALDDIVLNTSWRYQALDVNGVVLGAPLIIQEGTDINIVRSGNTLIFNSTAGGGDPDQTISYTESTKTLFLSGNFSSVQLDGLVDDTSWSGTSGTITYSLLDTDDTLVGDPLIFNAGSGMTITRSLNTLTFSASGASLWTDAGTYYRPNNLSNLASNSFRIYDTGRVTIGGTSDPTPYLLSVNGIGRFTSGVSLNGDLEFTNSSDIVFDSGGSGNIVDTNGVSGSSGKFLGHDGGGVAWVDAPGYTPTYATSTGNADTFTTGTYVNINGASTTYTIPVTEVLAVWCSVIILGGSSGANVTVSIRKNSSIILISRTIFVEAGVEKNISLHSNDDFNSGDTLRIHCSTSGSGFETVSTNTTWITVT